jgi:pantoate--beta-alanine ligase
MVDEQGMKIEIVGMPIVREPDGLAMSSRNVYLSPAERQAALALPRALAVARRLVMNDRVTDADAVRAAIKDFLFRGVRLSIGPTAGQEPGRLSPFSVESGTTAQPDSSTNLTVDYVSVSDEQTLEELKTIDRPALVLLAARVGATRLIDNTIVVPKGHPVPPQLQAVVEADVTSLSNLSSH